MLCVRESGAAWGLLWRTMEEDEAGSRKSPTKRSDIAGEQISRSATPRQSSRTPRSSLPPQSASRARQWRHHDRLDATCAHLNTILKYAGGEGRVESGRPPGFMSRPKSGVEGAGWLTIWPFLSQVGIPLPQHPGARCPDIPLCSIQ